MTNNYSKLLLIILFFTIHNFYLFSQVTIGSAIPPVSGALLDLKEFETETNRGGANSSKGMILPRLNLSSRNTLTDILSSIATTSNTEHIGLLVYNVNKCFYGGKGLYVWSGVEWTSILNKNIDLNGLNEPSSYEIAPVAQTLTIPLSKAFSAWEFYSSSNGGNLLQPLNTTNNLSVIISNQQGDIIDGSPLITGHDRNGHIDLKIKGNIGSAIISLKIGEVIYWSWHIQVKNS